MFLMHLSAPNPTGQEGFDRASDPAEMARMLTLALLTTLLGF